MVRRVSMGYAISQRWPVVPTVNVSMGLNALTVYASPYPSCATMISTVSRRKSALKAVAWTILNAMMTDRVQTVSYVSRGSVILAVNAGPTGPVPMASSAPTVFAILRMNAMRTDPVPMVLIASMACVVMPQNVR